MKTNEEINFADNVDYHWLLKETTSNIEACYSRIKVNLEDLKTNKYDEIVGRLNVQKNEVSEAWKEIKNKGIVFKTEKEVDDYLGKLSKTNRKFLFFERYFKLPEDYKTRMEKQANDPAVIAYYKTVAEEFGDIDIEIKEYPYD